jgi:hypothetical protein
VRRPVLAAIALSLLALLFGWETRQALRATPGRHDNSAIAAGVVWRPGSPAPDPEFPPDPTPVAAAVTARPVFRPDRQPFREDGSGVSGRNHETELSRFTLIGVLSFGDAPFGVVVEKAGNVVGKAGTKGERWEVSKGDRLGGFKVKDVGMEGLRLTADGREFLLPLYAGPPTAATGALRTDASRRDAAQPTVAPGSAAPARPGAPPASAAPARPAGFPPAGPATAVAPAPAQTIPPPPAGPRSSRGRR